jgi:hypothetical protein
LSACDKGRLGKIANLAHTLDTSGEIEGATLVVARARQPQGDSQLGEQLFAAVDQLVQNPAAPQDQRQLGKALFNILVGETSPSLGGLPPELALMVRGLLARLRN